MAHPKVADGDSLQVWWVVVLDKQQIILAKEN
jgi:hypothetical protein